ncbi:DUF294 nucleotidyltransferase-like domain-containing protein [Bacillaceae bacterium IKA-2]|nr:DUF294 nucleotidyltransferase-like domain-containing protein [Bacillaceae bacterium IKA-2]
MENKVEDEKLRKTYPFDLLTNEEFAEISKEAKLLRYKKNEFIFHADEAEDQIELNFLVDGLAKNILHKENGEQFSVRYYYPGDLIGLIIILANDQMKFSVQALQDSQVIRLKKKAFLEVMNHNKEFSELVLAGIGQRMKTLYNEIRKERSEEDSENIPLFRTRVNTIMEEPVSISAESTVFEAAKLLKEKIEIGLVVVDDQKLVGTLTQRDMLEVIMTNSTSKLVKDVMNKKPYLAAHDSFGYDILSYFKDDHVDFIPVMKEGKVVGVLKADSFLQLHDSNYISLSHQVHHASTIPQLQKLAAVNNQMFIDFVEQLLSENTYAYDVSEIISNYNDKIHRQVIKITLKEMKQEGYKTPPVNYCFIVMGSQGRKEQAFSTDQDNGLILDNYDHLANKEVIEQFFQRFSEKVNESLALCGFPLCTGGVMAKEKDWSRSLDEWVLEVERWVRETDAEEIRKFTIFIDYRPIFGDFSLARQIRERTARTIQKSQMLQLLLMKDTIRFRVPLNPLGMITTTGKSKMLNIKKAAIMQIVNGVRIFSIKNGSKEVSTLKRLDHLKQLEAFHPRDVKNAKTAMHLLLTFRLRNNINQLRSDQQLSNDLSLDTLNKEEKKQLKEALTIAKRLQQMSELSFGRKRGI